MKKRNKNKKNEKTIQGRKRKQEREREREREEKPLMDMKRPKRDFMSKGKQQRRKSA